MDGFVVEQFHPLTPRFGLPSTHPCPLLLPYSSSSSPSSAATSLPSVRSSSELNIFAAFPVRDIHGRRYSGLRSLYSGWEWYTKTELLRRIIWITKSNRVSVHHHHHHPGRTSGFDGNRDSLERIWKSRPPQLARVGCSRGRRQRNKLDLNEIIMGEFFVCVKKYINYTRLHIRSLFGKVNFVHVKINISLALLFVGITSQSSGGFCCPWPTEPTDRHT